MKTVVFGAMLFTLLSNNSSTAAIIGSNQLEIDLTNREDAHKKATWKPASIKVTKDGLGWDGEHASSHDFWLMTKPLAIGTSWRPATSASVRVTITPEAREFKLHNGQRSYENVGSMFVRYSPDIKHWSTWQAVGFSREAHAKAHENAKAGSGYVPFQRSFSTTIAVPRIARQEYSTLLREYMRSDAVWTSDEEALTKQIVADNPIFFEKELPYVGYVQILYECNISGGLRLKSLKADVGWGVGGIQSIPKDPSVQKDRNGAWRFVAE